ncbi:MAG: hypothetical protein QM758_15670 [Armatimonas sp.]
MSHTDRTLAARQRDNQLRWWYYRPFVLLLSGLAVIIILLAIGALTLPARLRKEWEGMPIQKGDVICVRSEAHFPQKLYWWDSTYLIGGTEHTAQELDSCRVGKEYKMLYQIGHHGRLAVISRKLL